MYENNTELDLSGLDSEEKEGKKLFLESIDEDFISILNSIGDLPSLELKSLDPDKTVLVIIDIVNGFVREGLMHSKRIEDIISPVLNLMDDCESLGIKKLAFADCHSKDCTEFSTFPVHCVKGTSESEIIDEIKENGGYTLIEKNSTNGFHAPDFQKFMSENPNIQNYIVCGDCTDICVMNFCSTLKTYFDQHNKDVNVIVPINAVETFDLPVHNGDFMNVMALQFMESVGVELVNDVVLG